MFSGAGQIMTRSDSIVKPYWLPDPGDARKQKDDPCKPCQLAPGLAAALEYLNALNEYRFAGTITGVRTNSAGTALEIEAGVMRVLGQAATKMNLITYPYLAQDFGQRRIISQQVVIGNGRLIKCRKSAV